MPRKKSKPFPATKAVKLAARELLGSPPAVRVVPDQKKKKQSSRKHKPTLGQMLQEL